MINLEQPSTWPNDVRLRVDELATLTANDPNNTPDTPMHELELGDIERKFEEEHRLRNLLADRPLLLYHASRLLPHEQDSVRVDGLMALSEDHRAKRFARVRDVCPQIDRERLLRLERSGPLAGRDPSNRLGMVHCVAPLNTPYESDDGVGGAKHLLRTWGGEAIYFADDEHADNVITLAELSALSTATIVEFRALAQDLCTYRDLWPVFVAQQLRRPDGWNQFTLFRSIEPVDVLDLITPESTRWPRRLPRW